MVHGANRSRKDFGAEIVIVEDGADFSDQFHAVDAHIIDTTDEWRNKGSASLGSEQSLIGREAECNVGLVTIGRQCLTSLEAVEREWKLDADIVCDLGNHCCFLHDLLVFGRSNFSRNRTLDDGADFFRYFKNITARFQDQRWIGGHAIDQSKIVEFADFLDVRSVDEKLHNSVPP
ncbi:hypothetical protein D9M70_574290 [compost metagenome]